MAARQEIDDEVRDYFERAHAEYLRDGLSPKEAARAARRELGDIEHAREDLLAYGWENIVSAITADVSLALRRLCKSPMFTTVAALTLALGIGATTAIVSAAMPILFRSLPYPDADRVVMLSDMDPAGAPFEITYGTFLEVASRSHSFSALAAEDRWQPALAGTEPEQIAGSLVTPDYFTVLGVAPAIGREFTSSDDQFGSPRVAIVSNGFAQRRFGTAANALSESISLDGEKYTVIGVMPPGFVNVVSPAAEVWAPRRFRERAPFNSTEWGHHMRMIGRLLPQVSVEQTRNELARVGAEQIEEFPRPTWAMFERGLLVDSLQASVTAGSRPMLLTVLGAVLLLLVIACANVANLLLAHGIARRTELAVRTALGAARRRLIRQLLTESLVLAALGGLAGLGVAALGVRAIVVLAPPDLPRVNDVKLDVSVFLFAFLVTLVVGVVVGLVPALKSTQVDLRVDLHAGARSIGGHQALRRALVVTEVALALMLLIGAGLLLRSVNRLLDTEPGFDPANMLTLQIVAANYRNRSPEEAEQYFRTVLDNVQTVPGVVNAALTSQLPLSGSLDEYGVQFASDADAANVATTSALRFVVTPSWFDSMRIALTRGRLLDAQDVRGAPEAVLINESFARRQFGDRNPIGERLRIGPEIGQENRPWDVVVGVVDDIKINSLALDAPNAFYVALGQWPLVDTVQSLVVRTQGDPLAVLPAVRQAIWSVDATPPLARITTMQQLLTASEAQRIFALSVFSVFAVAALALSALGLYGVIAGNVAERTREIGLRAALGATRLGILTLVMRQGMKTAVVGLALGLLGAGILARNLEALLYRTGSLDPATFIGVAALLCAFCAVACLLPAWRAAQLDPTVALRSE